MTDASPDSASKATRLALLTWDIGDVGVAGGVQKAETTSYDVWMAIISPAHREPRTIARLLAALLVDEAEQILHPSLMPVGLASASLFADGSWHVARGRTIPPWAEREIARIAALLEKQHRSFLEGAADALNGDLGDGFCRPDADFIIQDDTGHTVLAEAFPEVDVNLSESDRVAKGLKWYDVVRLDYRRDRFMRHLTDQQIQRRLSDITANLTRVTDQGLIAPLLPGDPLVYWTARFTEVMEEIALRYGPYPAGLAEGRIRPSNLPGSLDRRNLGTPRELRKKRQSTAFLVKYGREKFLRPALERGSLRISPASAYLDPSLNAAVRDDELSAEIDYAVFSLPPVAEVARRASPGARIRATQRMTTNYYVFCTSRALELRLLSDFDGDSCLVVHDIPLFSRRLQSTISRALPGWSVNNGDVNYYDPLQVMPGQVNLPLSKHFRYAYQREYRFVWLPPESQGRLDPLHVELGRLDDIAEIVVPKIPRSRTPAQRELHDGQEAANG